MSHLSPQEHLADIPPAQQTPHRQSSVPVVPAKVARLIHSSFSGHRTIPEPITVVRRMHSADWPSMEVGVWNPSSFSRLKLGEMVPREKCRCKGQNEEERMPGRPKLAQPLQSEGGCTRVPPSPYQRQGSQQGTKEARAPTAKQLLPTRRPPGVGCQRLLTGADLL